MDLILQMIEALQGLEKLSGSKGKNEVKQRLFEKINLELDII